MVNPASPAKERCSTHGQDSPAKYAVKGQLVSLATKAEIEARGRIVEAYFTDIPRNSASALVK